MEGIVCKHLLAWGPSFVNLLSLSEIYTGKVVMRDLQVQIKISTEHSLLSKLPLRDHICVFMWKKTVLMY